MRSFELFVPIFISSSFVFATFPLSVNIIEKFMDLSFRLRVVTFLSVLGSAFIAVIVLKQSINPYLVNLDKSVISIAVSYAFLTFGLASHFYCQWLEKNNQERLANIWVNIILISMGLLIISFMWSLNNLLSI